MSEEITHLKERIQELENIAREYARLQELIDYAVQGQDLTRYMPLSVLYVDPTSKRIVDVNDTTLELLGYSRNDFLSMTIDDLETPIADAANVHLVSPEDPTEASVYSAIYKHCAGYSLTVTVHKSLLSRENRPLLYYRLSDQSPHRRLWYELQRREDGGFNFQQKLTALNEVTVELSKIESFDMLCFHVIKLGMERLDFDRLGLWLVDTDYQMMRGTYGVDEQGNIRSEHGESWTYVGRHIFEFINGKTDKPLIFDDAPLYNEKSEIIHYGWHVTVPVLNGRRCIGTLSADNYRRSQAIRSYEPELLRLYGITVGHLMELSRSREQATALRIANQLTNMLSEFITNIGHDFRTPLSIINNKAYLLQRSQEVEQRRSLTDGIQHQVRHISDTVDRALEFVALQRSPTLERIPVNIASLLNSLIQRHKAAADKKQIQVQITVNQDLTIQADMHYLSRALTEILENALQFTGEGGQIHLDCVEYPEEIGIRVRDNGIGMDKDTLNRAFDPLYRGDQARTDRHSGLGLPIAEAIAELHGGRITLESIVGKGSTFEVIFAR